MQQSKDGNCNVLRDFNGDVESLIDGYEAVHRKLGMRIPNKDGKRLVKFADSVGIKSYIRITRSYGPK